VAKDDSPEFEDLGLPEEAADLDELDLGDQTAGVVGAAGGAEVPPAGEPTENQAEGAEGEEAEVGAVAPLAEEPKKGRKRKKEKKKKAKKRPKAKKREEPEEEEAERPSLLDRLRSTSPYTVMLAISLLAMLIGVLMLYVEFSRYNFDMKAEELKDKLGAVETIQLAPPTTSVVA